MGTPDELEWRRQVAASPVFTYSEALGRVIRAGTPEDQAASNLTKIRMAITDHDGVEAAAYGNVFLEEARILFEMDADAHEDARNVLEGLGLTREELSEIEAGIRDILRRPDGTPFRRETLWTDVRAAWTAFDELCRLGDLNEAYASADGAKELSRQLQDRDTDFLMGLLNVVLTRHGEEAVHAAWVTLNERAFADRYKQYDVSRQPWTGASLDALLYITFEGGRWHLVGPERTGDCEFWDEGDRWAWRWDPCGTCGRAIRGDAIEGTPPRPEPPYGWPVLSRAFDWSWNKVGISAYGVQACIKLEQMGIDTFGYPIRVVDCPTYPDGKDQPCVRYVYKDPTKVPQEYYERVGRSKPTVFGSAETRRRRV
jgi:hypothetical protein